MICTSDHRVEHVAPVGQPAPTIPDGPTAEDVAAKIAAHVMTSGATFWAGGVPEVRSTLGIDVDGQTIAAAFRRIERGRVAGITARAAGSSYRSKGTYSLWTVSIASKTR
jgi:hypothetical protein